MRAIEAARPPLDANARDLTTASSQSAHNHLTGENTWPTQTTCVIARIDIVGTAASARIDTNDISGFCFTDFFNLLKVEGRWLVVSKIYHTHVVP